MTAFKRTSLPLLFILLGVFACALPALPVLDPGAAGTSVAETVNAIIEATRLAGEDIDLTSSNTPTVVLPFTATATGSQTPTLTPTSTPTLTATLPLILSFTPLVTMISVSVPTNCREGPGRVYKMVGALLVGQTVQVYARTADGDYWYIRNPDSTTQFCWVWGEYATLTGPTAALPVYTPPPSPTPTFTRTPAPGFRATYDGADSCSGWYYDFLVKNTGWLAFKSISLTVKDTVTSTSVNRTTNGFINKTGCDSTGKDVLLSGKSTVVSSGGFGYNPHGHRLRATMTLCSSTGLNGTCVTDTLVFTP